MPQHSFPWRVFVNELYECRGTVRSLEVTQTVLASDGTARVVDRRKAMFTSAGDVDREIVFAASPAESFDRIEREFRGGHCALETTFSRNGEILSRRRTLFDTAGRPLEEIAEDPAGRPLGGKSIVYSDDGTRIEEVRNAPAGAFHFQLEGTHFPVERVATIRSVFDERSRLRAVRFIAPDGSMSSEIRIEYDERNRRRDISHHAGKFGTSPLSRVRFEYDDAAHRLSRTIELNGEVVEQTTSRYENGTGSAVGHPGVVYRDEVNETGDWIRRTVVHADRDESTPRTIIERAIAYW